MYHRVEPLSGRTGPSDPTPTHRSAQDSTSLNIWSICKEDIQ